MKTVAPKSQARLLGGIALQRHQKETPMLIPSCLEHKNISEIKPHHQQELEEIWGVLYRFEATPEGGIVALISKILVHLPEELAGRLQGLIGRRIAVLKLDGYHVRCLDEKEVHS